MVQRSDDAKPTTRGPEIKAGFEPWIADFFRLSTDRQLTGYGSGPIPNASIMRHVAGWDDTEADMFEVCIRAMDTAFLDALAPKKDDDGKPSVKMKKPVGEMTPAKFDALFG